MVDPNAVVHQIIDGCSHTNQETFRQANHACYILDEMMDGCGKGERRYRAAGRIHAKKLRSRWLTHQ
jgi:hypothetical protein